MKKRILTCITIALACMTLSSCEILQSLATEMTEYANLTKCEFSLKNVSNLSIAGVNVKALTNGNITAADVLKLTSALLNKKVPMDMNVNINVKNPNQQNAAMSAMDWQLEIEGTQYATGTTSQRYSIPQGQTSTVPLGVNTDLYNLFSKNGVESLKRFVSSFNNEGISSKVGLKIKPKINIGNRTLEMKDFIKIEKTI